MNTYFHRVARQTPTRFWINNVTREQARLALDAGAVGCTQNPAYTWKMLQGPDKAHAIEVLDEILRQEPEDSVALIRLQRALVEEIALAFLPLYRESGGKHGYVSIQGDPFHEDCESIVRWGRFNAENLPNIMLKVPATEEGLKAIDILLREGYAINATEVMALRQAADVCDVYTRATAGMERPPVAFFSHIAGIFDEHMTAAARDMDIPKDYVWQAGIAAAKKIYQYTKTHAPAVGMISGGARGLHHFTEMVGADAVVTINWAGTADKLLEQDPPVVQRFLAPVPLEVTDTLCRCLPEFRQAYELHAIEPKDYEDFGPVVRFRGSFEKAWASALDFIRQRRTELSG